MKNHLIYLIGFMGTGKSTVSGYLHARFGLDRLEMDREIARRAGKSISAIFGEDGEEVFRDMETELLRELFQKENLVVSCGGGTVLRDENVRLMKASGTLILLDASAEEIYERVKHSHTRPLLEGNMNIPYIRKLLDERLPRYRAVADLTIASGSRPVAEIGSEIYRQIEALDKADEAPPQ